MVNNGESHKIPGINGLELILSILISISLAQGLSWLVSIHNTLTWLTSSIVLLIISISLIYFILDVDFVDFHRDVSRLITVGFISFLPFSVQRYLAISNDVSFFWNSKYVAIHVMTIGALFGLWAHFERKVNPENPKISILRTLALVIFLFGILYLGFN